VTEVGPATRDVQLHERLVAGDEGALVEAYNEWSALVHTIAARVTADHDAAQDLTQEVFVHLWERPDAYDPARGAMRTWLCLLARRRALDWTRRRQARTRYQTTAGKAELAAYRAQPEVDDALTWETETKAVREAVRSLPESQREAVVLAYFEGHTYREVARELRIPEGTAKTRLRSALATVAAHLADEGLLER
jgi:RNA polymerase sigma factor (sigma-70 family)